MISFENLYSPESGRPEYKVVIMAYSPDRNFVKFEKLA